MEPSQEEGADDPHSAVRQTGMRKPECAKIFSNLRQMSVIFEAGAKISHSTSKIPDI
jgi:hypothetical protein